MDAMWMEWMNEWIIANVFVIHLFMLYVILVSLLGGTTRRVYTHNNYLVQFWLFLRYFLDII